MAWPFNEFEAIDQHFLTIVCVLTKGVCGGCYQVLSLKLTLETRDPLRTNAVLLFVMPHKKKFYLLSAWMKSSSVSPQ